MACCLPGEAVRLQRFFNPMFNCMSKNITRTVLSKRRICEKQNLLLLLSESVTNASVGQWAKENLELESVSSKAAISRIVNKSTELLAASDKRIAKKQRIKHGAENVLEKVSFIRICEQQARRVFIDGEIIFQEAHHVMSCSYKYLREDRRINLKFLFGLKD